jgi:threonylcarbamoyladenosine tRNA methylthiotransferase MtaB
LGVSFKGGQVIKNTGYKHLKVALDTLGCKVNQAETEQLARQFAAAGYQLVSPADEADIYVLNTCTVTHVADRKSRHWLRLAHRRNPRALLVATGCYAERAAEELARLEGVTLVVSNTDKSRLVETLEDNLSLREVTLPKPDDEAISALPTEKHPFPPQSEPSHNELPELPAIFRTRTFIKIQDGCQNFCYYCIVPLVRNREASLPVEQVIAEMKERQAEGYKEIVITGVEVGSYNDNGVDLTGLLERILEETDIPRLRLSSLQPPEITPELLNLWQDPRLCRHFHLSLQSGSDTVLKRMNRRYTTTGYARAVSLIRSSVPDVAITTDIIVGFPGETEAEFEKSYQFCKQMDFARIHVFPYSPRTGTKAAKLSGPVGDKIKKQLTDRMLTLADECVQNFSRKFLGRTMPVLFEQKDNSLWSGLTDNYIRVYVESGEDLANKIVKVRVEEIRQDRISGYLVK